jgi:type 1 glutamine amidotransferase
MQASKRWLVVVAVLSGLSASLLGLVRGSAAPAADDPKPIRALLVIGGCCHEYVKQKDIITSGISGRALVQWAISYDPDTGTKHVNPIYAKPDWAKGFDVVVHDECCSDVKDPEIINRILEPHRQGLPGVVLHCGMHSYRGEGYPKMTKWYEFTGLQTNAHDAQEPIAITFEAKDSPITKGLKDWSTGREELYNNVSGKLLDTATPLARGKQVVKRKGGKEVNFDFVVAWTNMYTDKTKVFATTLGHNSVTVADERYLDLITRGLLWSVGKLEPAYLKPSPKVMID